MMRAWVRRTDVGVATGAALAAAIVAVMLSGLRPATWVALVTLPIAGMLLRPVVPILDVRRFSIPSVWFLTYVTVMFLPGLWVYADHPGRYGDMYFRGITVALLAVPLGVRLTALVLRARRDEVDAYFSAPMLSPRDDLHSRVIFGAMLAVTVALSIGYVIEAPVLPLFYLIRNPGSGAELVLLREESFKLLDSPLRYAYDVVRRVTYPYLAVLAMAMASATKRPGWRTVALMVSMGGALFAGLSAAKAPVAFMFLVLVLGGMLVRKRRTSPVWLVAGAGAFLSFPLLILMLSGGSDSAPVAFLVGALLQRMFYLPAEILYYYFEIYPDQMGYLHGGTIGRLSVLLGRPEFDVSNHVFRYMYPNGLESGSATTAFVGALHADFGLAGILVGSLLAGALMELVQVKLMRHGKTPTTVALYSFLTFAFFLINVEPLSQALLSGGIGIVLAIALAQHVGEHMAATATGRPTFAGR